VNQLDRLIKFGLISSVAFLIIVALIHRLFFS